MAISGIIVKRTQNQMSKLRHKSWFSLPCYTLTSQMFQCFTKKRVTKNNSEFFNCAVLWKHLLLSMPRYSGSLEVWAMPGRGTDRAVKGQANVTLSTELGVDFQE